MEQDIAGDFWLSPTDQHNVKAPQQADALEIVEYLDVVPLAPQFGAPEEVTAPEQLSEALFSQPAPTPAEVTQAGGDADLVPPMRLYALLDGAKLPYILTSLLETSGLTFMPLFQGATQQELGEHAPYLVQLEVDNGFTRSLFTKSDSPYDLWGKDLGIFVRTRADIADVRKHFRRFTRIQDVQQKWYYFRFWEPQILASYFSHERHSGATADRWFFGRNGVAFESYLIVRDHVTHQIKHALVSPEAGVAGSSVAKVMFRISDDLVQMWRNLAHLTFVEGLQNQLFEDPQISPGANRKRFNDFITAQVHAAQQAGFTIETAVRDVVTAACLAQKSLAHFPPDMATLLHHSKLPQLSRARKIRALAMQIHNQKERS